MNVACTRSRVHVGFSLLEMMFALFIGLLLLSFAFPYTSAYFQRHQLQNAQVHAEEMVYATRMLAYQFQQPITLCPTNDGRECGVDWSKPWIAVRGHGELRAILRRFSAFSSGIAVDWHGFTSGPITLVRERNNRVSGQLILRGGNAVRILTLNRSGEIRVDKAHDLG